MSRGPARQRRRGFCRAARLLDERVRKAGEARGFAVSRLLTHWDEIVGPETAALARPVKIAYGRGGMGATLTLLASGAAAPLVQMRLPRIRERVNACYGYAAIGQIRVTQTAAEGLSPGFAEAQAGFVHAPPASDHAADPGALDRAREAAAPVADPSLRAALETLGRHVLARKLSPRKVDA